MSTRQLSREQQDKLAHVSLMGGLKGAVFGLGLGLITTVVAQKRSPNFQAISTPMKSMILGSGMYSEISSSVCLNGITELFVLRLATVAGYLFGSERDAVKYENVEYGYLDENELRALSKAEGTDRLSAKDSLVHYLNQNRWSIIGNDDYMILCFFRLQLSHALLLTVFSSIND